MLKFFQVFSRRRWESLSHSPVDTFLNAEAIVSDTIPCDGKGKVRIFGSYWPAKAEIPWEIPVGTRVVVRQREGMALVVRPLPVPIPHRVTSPSIRYYRGLKTTV